MNVSGKARTWRMTLVTAARITGWIAASAGILVCLLCAILYVSRSPDDFEGLGQFAAVHVALVYGLPLLLVGITILWGAGRAGRKAQADAPYPP